jgi:hypothetical protein
MSEEQAEYQQPESLPGLLEGRIVHYVAYNGRHLAAIVIGHDGSKSYSDADIALFTNMNNVNGSKSFGLQFHQDIPYSETKEPGTWHWIERSGPAPAHVLTLAEIKKALSQELFQDFLRQARVKGGLRAL